MQPVAGSIAAVPVRGEAAATTPPANTIPDEWMHIAGYLHVPDLCHLACTAMRFRSVMTTCLKRPAAQVTDSV